MEKKKKKLPLKFIALSVAIILCAVLGVLCVTGYLPIPTSEGIITLEMATLRKKARNVQDEKTLRELLLVDEKLDIVVTKDIEISDTFLVNGTKTLYGDATIKMNIVGLFTEKGAFQIQGGAALTVDGLTIDGTGMADGIVVNQRAKLTYKSGRMQYVRYGIRTNGEVTVEDATMEHIATAGVFASFRSKVYVNGGNYSDAYTSLLRVDSGGYMEIADGVVARESKGDIIYNEGTLRVYGGIYTDSTNAAINNMGDLVTEYKGSKKDGSIRFNNIGKIGVRIDSDEDNEIADIYATNVGTNGIFVTDKETQGKTSIQNCVFDTTGNTSGNTFSLSAKVNVKNVTIKNSQKGSVYIRKGAKVTIEDLQIQDCNGTAMDIQGTLNGKKITIDGATGNGISIMAPEKTKNKVNLSEIQTSNVVKNNFLLRAKATATVKDSVFGASERTSIYLSNDTVCTLENIEVQGATDKDVYSVALREGSNTTLLGKSVIKGGFLGSVWIDKKATFNMESGKITGTKAANDGGGVHLRPEATFNLKGGEITGNTSAKAGGGVYIAKDATFNMTGGTISNNKSVNSGGGVYVLGTMNFTGGTITGNKANTVGDGISHKGTVVIGGSAYMAKDEIALGSTSTVLRLKGSSLHKHNAKEPLLIEPEMSTTPGVIVAECDSASASTKMLSHVASGSKAYTLRQTGNKMTVSINEADMDMTGADTVYVSNYKELKEAVETTDTKRFVILTNDIKVDAAIVVPTGVTVYVRDDGTPRTISRSAGKGSNIFRTYYGTGLYLVGTSYGNLILDGTTTADKKAEDIDPLVRVRGTTEIRNVAFKNNNTSENGGFVRQNYGSTSVYSSTFTNGKAFSGGAVVAEQGKFYVKDSIFNGNSSQVSGGAIRSTTSKSNPVDLTVVSCEFKNNSAGSLAGAINNDGGTLKVTNTNFLNNTAGDGHGGAIGITNTVSAEISGGGIFKDNRSSTNGGAIYTNNSKLSVKGYTFEGNHADNGGAVMVNNGSNNGTSAITVKECTFDGNGAASQGGAIYNGGRTVTVTDVSFGVSAGNTSQGNGGAIYNAGKGTLNLVGTEKNRAVFYGNVSTGGNGGAICVGTGELNIKGYEFRSNSAVNGGAINLNNDKINAVISKSGFYSNAASGGGGAVYNNNGSNAQYGITMTDCNFGAEGQGNTAVLSGGAVYTKAELKLTNTSFTENSAYNGGAIFIAGGDNANDKITISNSKFVKNHADYRGGAMSINARVVAITDTMFGGTKDDGNTAKDRYGAIYSGSGANVTLNGTDVKKAVFSYNSAPWGGAYGMGSGTTTISGYAFQNNTATGRAGAFYIGGGTLNIVGNGAGNEVFEENKAADGGALYLGNASILNVTGYTFQKNSATNGGLLRTDGVEGQKASFTGSVIQENTASQKGGAIYNQGRLTTNLVTFSKNTSEKFGGAIYNDKTAELTDTKFTGNGGEQGGAIAQENANAAITAQVSGKNPDMAVFESNTTNWNGAAIRTSAGSVTLKGYQFKSHESKNNGGAIYVDGTTVLEVEGCTFTDNTALKNAKNGGAIAVWSVNARAKITGSVFERNKAVNLGGAVVILNGKLEVIGSTFRENEALLGGAIGLNDNKAIQADLTECIFEKNTATDQGGAVYSGAKENDGQTLTVTNCQFGGTGKDGTNLGNTATNQGGAIYMNGGAGLVLSVKENAGVPALMEGNRSTANEGGAVYRASNSVGGVDITGYTFTKNYAKTNGGAVCVRGKISVNVKNSVFGGDGTSADAYALGNKADGNGGAIYIGNEATLKIDGDSAAQSVFKGNTAKGYGGAVAVGTRNLYVNNTTFEYNKATGTGGAIRVNCSANTTVSVRNSSFKYNSSSGGGAISTARKTYTYPGCTFEGNTPNDTSKN